MDTYEALLRCAPPSIDLLLPHASGNRKPTGPPGAYADWLIPIFDRWFGAAVRETRTTRLVFPELCGLAVSRMCSLKLPDLPWRAAKLSGHAWSFDNTGIASYVTLLL